MRGGLRCFVAAVPPPEVIDHLEEFLAPRRHAAAYRWTRSDQWHVTLAFTAALPERAIDDLVTGLESVGDRHRPLDLAVGGGVAFPHPDGARVLAAGVRGERDDLTALDRLATGCRTALSRAGSRADGQRFRAHLTLARLSWPDNVTPWVRLLDAYDGPPWRLEEVTLVASHLGEGPRRGPRHEPLAEIPLG